MWYKNTIEHLVGWKTKEGYEDVKWSGTRSSCWRETLRRPPPRAALGQTQNRKQVLVSILSDAAGVSPRADWFVETWRDVRRTRGRSVESVTVDCLFALVPSGPPYTLRLVRSPRRGSCSDWSGNKYVPYSVIASARSVTWLTARHAPTKRFVTWRGKFKSKSRYHDHGRRASSSPQPVSMVTRDGCRATGGGGGALPSPWWRVDVFHIWHQISSNVPPSGRPSASSSWFKATYICDDFNKTFS